MSTSKGKGISYEAQEPAFLRRLRASQSGQDADRHDRAIARPKRPKKPQDDEDDGPTYVDEDGEVVRADQVEALVAGRGGEEVAAAAADTGLEKDTAPDEKLGTRRKQEVLEVGGPGAKKRKVAKVVGKDDGEAEEGQNDKEGGSAPKEAPKLKKKAKAIKLSFNDEEG